ncbi:hypothetical protein HFE03_07255 [Paenibacillus sp. EKM102P]|uniref:hypothetical protein n=1 Tax=unclassified Paenibacillus TaxID=185978 RepID=UPI00142E3C03|nr:MULTISPECIES: hypothetical protein [unclassified Paenibacillus]KAF6620444.1 hypothetical protein HFE00_05160 [Paenibacillus sp. EKM101P]KAF6623436.1 hypothetical protein HFE03_07255 [Paenibacillus sp. EKM102P]KAF6634002.1 hypothetical protein HFE01_07255 [Paenibacillus sp. EKM10P]KAF6649528.1 hypothetical protein HFE02_02215 [Paenibacillus sp. EKM11P]
MTPYSKIFERFQGKIQDYTIDEMFLNSIEDYENYLTGFLKSGLVKFSYCKNDLSDRDEENRNFTADLTELEQEILSQLMLSEWFEKEVNNILDMRLAISSTDWKRYSESQNFKEKAVLRDKAVERADSLMMQYYLKNMSVN